MISPSEMRKIYVNNTEAFYKAAGGDYLAAETDEFLRACVIGLWARSGGVTESNVALINELYSKNQPGPKYLYWELTSVVCAYSLFQIPDFFTGLAAADRLNKTTVSRTFIRIFANILLTVASSDDDVSIAEAQFITSCTEALESVCDRSGVAPAKRPLNAADYITSPEPSFLQGVKPACPQQEQTTGEGITQTVADNKDEAPAELDELMAQLDELVGLERIKSDVRSLINLIKVRKLRTEHGLTAPPISLHMVFMGNPGTGKTTVARLLAGIYKAMGVLSKGQLVEVDRSQLVAGYVGQTAIKTAEALEKAKGGILFIDEAYSLTPDASGNDYGREAVEIILKGMEDNRDDLVVIVAGYENLMEKFISSNPGLESRFSKYFVFEDYTGEQLNSIFLSMCKKNEYLLTPEASERARELLNRLYEQRDDNFGNARDVRNLFERAVSMHSDRVASIESPSKEDLITLIKEDIPDF
ncbi:MAG: AAA family ATPase [Clostridiales bacterium]|nr:AAA family ATPase [Clostridiales bacterium]